MDKNVDTTSPEALVNDAKHEAQAALRAVEDAMRSPATHISSVAYHVERLQQLVDELEEALQS